VRTRLAELANGNPLFAILLAAHYAETGESGGVPPTLIESLTRRLEPLPRISLTVLATCIALGKHCNTDRLLRALEITPIALLETIADLTDAGLLDSQTDHIAAAHPLVGDALERTVSPSVRRTVSSRAAEVFERDAIRLKSPALWWEAATRWQEAGDADRAIGAFRECARHALEIGRAGEAARMLDAALRLAGSPECRLAAARELILAADHSSDPTLVLRGQEVLRVVDKSWAHDDLELAERRALLRSARLPEGLLEMTRDCLRAADASAQHRVEAATLALKCAEVFGTGQKAVELVERELSPSDVATADRLTQLEFELLLRSAKEDRDGAADIANELFGEIESQPLDVGLSAALNCGIALLLAGKLEQSVALLEKAYQRSVGVRSIGHQIRIAMVLGTLYDDMPDDRNWDIWLSRATDLAIHNPDLAQSFDLVVMRILRAFAAGDMMAVDYLLDEADDSGMFNDGTVRQRWGRAIHLLVKARKGPANSEDEETARSVFRDCVSSMHGYRDIEVAAAATILERNYREEALSLVNKYIEKERATRRPIARPLAETIRRLSSRTS
jgi:tetratricopeptide (TPR) repeat protein